MLKTNHFNQSRYQQHEVVVLIPKPPTLMLLDLKNILHINYPALVITATTLNQRRLPHATKSTQGIINNSTW